MVKKLALFLAYTLFFVVALIYFTPKGSFYFLIEQELEKYEVVISSEEITDNGFTLSIENANLSYKAIESANIGEVNIKIFALYNAVNLKNIIISPTMSSFVPLEVESVEIVYSIFDPLNLNARSIGAFGEVDAIYSIVDNAIHLELKPSKLMLKDYKNTLRSLKKTENGEFTYDKTF